MQHVDVLTIGAGGGAYPAAFRLAHAGRSVVMVDPKGVMSGNCLAEGCVPSKAVREVAAMYRGARRFGRFGLNGTVDIELPAVMAHKDRVQRIRYAQHSGELEPLAERLRLVQGRARFRDAHTVIVESDRGEKTYRADHVIVASGADISVPPLPGVELCLTSRDLFALNPTLTDLPRRVVVIGGGYIGLETATFLRAFGAEVTVLELMNQVLPGMDPGFVAGLIPLLDPAIGHLTDAAVEAIKRGTDGTVTVHYRQGERIRALNADAVLMATGRRPVLPEGSEAVGLEVAHGALTVDAAMRTSVPHVYACGDVNGRVPLFHAAVGQALTAARNILGGDAPFDYFDFESVPTTVFTLPAAACVGLTRSALRARGIEALETVYDFAGDSRAQILDETGGELRLFFAPGSLRLLGGWIIGLDAAQLVGQIGLAVSRGLTAHDLAAFCDQHPMASEGISRAARQLF